MELLQSIECRLPHLPIILGFPDSGGGLKSIPHATARPARRRATARVKTGSGTGEILHTPPTPTPIPSRWNVTGDLSTPWAMTQLLSRIFIVQLLLFLKLREAMRTRSAYPEWTKNRDRTLPM